MNDRDKPGFEPGKNCPLRRRHDDFVNKHAKRLGVEPAAILQSVRDFGLTAADIAAAEDASALTRYPRCNGNSIVFKVLGFTPVKKIDSRSCRHEFRPASPDGLSKKAKRAKQRTGKTNHKRKSDRGETSIAQALKRVGFKR